MRAEDIAVKVQERFIRYCQVDSGSIAANSENGIIPSTPGQR